MAQAHPILEKSGFNPDKKLKIGMIGIVSEGVHRLMLVGYAAFCEPRTLNLGKFLLPLMSASCTDRSSPSCSIRDECPALHLGAATELQRRRVADARRTHWR